MWAAAKQKVAAEAHAKNAEKPAAAPGEDAP